MMITPNAPIAPIEAFARLVNQVVLFGFGSMACFFLSRDKVKKVKMQTLQTVQSAQPKEQAIICMWLVPF